MKRAFTLIELLVVIAMLAILIGAVGSGVAQARQRAKIARATQDAKEITNAILGFGNYRTLEDSNGWKESVEGNLRMILGGETSETGEQVPVLYNAQLRGGAIRDPWGNTYKFMIKKVNGESKTGGTTTYLRSPNLPNLYRLTDEERQ